MWLHLYCVRYICYEQYVSFMQVLVRLVLPGGRKKNSLSVLDKCVMSDDKETYAYLAAKVIVIFSYYCFIRHTNTRAYVFDYAFIT